MPIRWILLIARPIWFKGGSGDACRAWRHSPGCGDLFPTAARTQCSSVLTQRLSLTWRYGKGIRDMKRLLLVTLLGLMLSSGTGCCIIDRIFHCPCGRWRGGGCGPFTDNCASCSGCQDPSCPYGDGCGQGGCGGPGDYGYGGPGGEMVEGIAVNGVPVNQPPMGPPGGPGCKTCLAKHKRGGGGAYGAVQGPPGPPTGQVAYPYYTTRGPRDFLAKNPPDIGP